MSTVTNDRMTNLVRIVNEIQDLFNQQRTAIEFDLPRIVVIGSLSVGKSSVLERIVGR